MRKISKVKLGVSAAAALALSIGLVSPAIADSYPGSGDAVITGSDTVQYTLDFLADGTPAGLPGFNAGKPNRVYSFSATADASGRAVFDSGGIALAPTSVLRSGNGVVTRPNGSHGGAKSLFQTAYFAGGVLTGAPMVNLARMSGLPFCTSEDAAAATAGFGGLHVYKFATEDLALATQTVTNAPTVITAADMVKIYDGTYTTWGQIPNYLTNGGTAGGATQAIEPKVPQSGSGTGSTFLADLKAANGGVAVTLAGTVLTVQENDYTGIGTANAIGPFSGGRIGLNDSGFFGPAAQNKVKPVNGAGSYANTRKLYIVSRQNDVASTTPYLPGSSANLITSFVTSPITGIRNAAYSGNIAAAGQVQSYQDLGRANTAGTTCDNSA